jgi:autoinducer 2-degrading protein
VSIIQVVHLEVQPDKLEEFLAEALPNVQASRTEPGVEQFDLLQQIESPQRFLLYEAYRDMPALEAHRSTPHFQRWLEKGVPLLVGNRIRVLYSRVE